MCHRFLFHETLVKKNFLKTQLRNEKEQLLCSNIIIDIIYYLFYEINIEVKRKQVYEQCDVPI